MASVVTADASYSIQSPGLIIKRHRTALYFAPAANLVMSSVRPQEQGVASGANNALREVGGALGIAIGMASIGPGPRPTNCRSFVDGLRPALVDRARRWSPSRKSRGTADPRPAPYGERLPGVRDSHGGTELESMAGLQRDAAPSARRGRIRRTAGPRKPGSRTGRRT
ncbi:hypothetical protein SHIRM173S_08674 [Streptomyces hirsutus]